MISYAPLYRTMKQKGITTYQLIHEHGVSRSLLDRLKHNKPITTVTINDLCRYLDCKVEDILEYVDDTPEQKWTTRKRFQLSGGLFLCRYRIKA